MKVFISSVISGFENYRDAAADAATSLDCDVIRVEDFPASPRSPQLACLQGVREADVVVLVLGERYGPIQPSGKSATHEEYEEARDRKPVFMFVQTNASMEKPQADFRREVEKWQGGHLWKGFTSPEELKKAVIAALHTHLLGLASNKPDENDLVERAQRLIPARLRTNDAVIAVALAGGPKQQILRPKELEEPGLRRSILRDARFGQVVLFDLHAETRDRIEGDALVVEQGSRTIRIDELGSILIELPAGSRDDGLPWLVEENLVGRVEMALQFASALLSNVDPKQRLGHLALACGLLGAGHMGWKTRAEFERNPNSGTMGMAGERLMVTLRPPTRTRLQLQHEAPSIAEDLVHLLRREHSPRR